MAGDGRLYHVSVGIFSPLGVLFASFSALIVRWTAFTALESENTYILALAIISDMNINNDGTFLSSSMYSVMLQIVGGKSNYQPSKNMEVQVSKTVTISPATLDSRQEPGAQSGFGACCLWTASFISNQIPLPSSTSSLPKAGPPGQMTIVGLLLPSIEDGESEG